MSFQWIVTTLGEVYRYFESKNMVREGGVEPPHRKAPDPKSGASTNSATLATLLFFTGKAISLKLGRNIIMTATHRNFCW